MKKIIATVLAMVMALALCSTAFAAADSTVTAKAYQFTTSSTAVAGEVKADFYKATAAKLNKDGKQEKAANVAYYVFKDVEYVVVSTLADADLVLYGDADATSVMLYLAKTNPHYNGTGTVFTNFGKSCGQLNYPNYDKDETYYTTNEKGNKALYKADDAGAVSLMVGGKLVSVTLAHADATATVEHSAIPTVDAKTGKVTGYTCSVCKLAAVKAANVASVPSGVQVVAGTDTWYFPAAAASTTTTTSSPKTFDAGIAMYVGMALTSVAGSAVVIGKKKEF